MSAPPLAKDSAPVRPKAYALLDDPRVLNILFAPTLGATPENDAAQDPTLRTYVDSRLGMSYRRIKHFTGYVVLVGFTDQPEEPGATTAAP